MELPSALIYRLGHNATNPSSIQTVTKIVFDAKTESAFISFASTDGMVRSDLVTVILQRDDIVLILEQAAKTFPRLADVFANCSATATTGYMEVTPRAPEPPKKSAGWMMDLLKTVWGKV